MTCRASLTAALFAAVLAAASGFSHPARAPDLVAHEWGTFTSIAGQDGRPTEWQPFGGPDDLPCFVNQFRNKLGLWGTVRMETPVIYFYAGENTRVDVSVRFKQGMVTEWFPTAVTNQPDIATYRRRGSMSTIAWPDVEVAPGGDSNFPTDGSGSHYYTARETDAAPLRAGREVEKFLFYRGVGSFPLPLEAIVAPDGRVTVTNAGADAIPSLVLYVNRGGVRTFQVYRNLLGSTTFSIAALDDESSSAAYELERALVAEGLYAKEAAAMVKTWGDSWFEEGARLFYIVPQRAIAEALPLQISPKPVETVRAFVGRLELVTPDIQRDVEQALTTNDQASLAKYSRFLQPIGDRILAALPASTSPRAIRQRLQAALPSAPTAVPAGCR